MVLALNTQILCAPSPKEAGKPALLMVFNTNKTTKCLQNQYCAGTLIRRKEPFSYVLGQSHDYIKIACYHFPPPWLLVLCFPLINHMSVSTQFYQSEDVTFLQRVLERQKHFQACLKLCINLGCFPTGGFLSIVNGLLTAKSRVFHMMSAPPHQQGVSSV